MLRIDPAGEIHAGGTVRMYTKVLDAETPSSGLAVTISYRPQGGSWTVAAPPTYNVAWSYWSSDWTIPGGAVTGLYDVKVDVSDGGGGSASYFELGEFTVVNII
jgi:hypothetical protein